MKRVSDGPILSTVFVDYDNIYLSLKRRSDKAAKQFAKDSGFWLEAILYGNLIQSKSSLDTSLERRVVMNRCYGNPVPRRNAHDNSTDMNSFPFVRHHFLRAGFEVIDCPPLTAQLKNSADIRIVMDIRDILNHETFFDEFIILSGDADFTPVLHRLRSHARRTVVYANDHTAQPYTALSDGEIHENALIELLLNQDQQNLQSQPSAGRELPSPQHRLTKEQVDAARHAIMNEVVNYVRVAPQAVPLETLADRAVRIVGHDQTVGTNWAGFGSFRDLLLSDLPQDLHLSDTPPYTVFDASWHISSTGLIAPQSSTPSLGTPIAAPPMESTRTAPKPSHQQPSRGFADMAPPPSQRPAGTPEPALKQQRPSILQAPQQRSTGSQERHEPRLEPRRPPAPGQQSHDAEQATQVQQSIARIHEACQAPALAPAEYRVLFDILAQEISANGLQESQTLINLTQRGREFGLDLKRDDLRFILEVISENDPWFEQGASAELFAKRFRNFVVARCQSQGLSLSADELDLIEAWFSAQAPQPRRSAGYNRPEQQAPAGQQHQPRQQSTQRYQADTGTGGGNRWWSMDHGNAPASENDYGAGPESDEMPLIVRTRLRG